MWGKVSNKFVDEETGTLWFDLDDGSGTPVKVADYAFDGFLPVSPNNGDYWKATGIIALKKDGSSYVRMLIIDGLNAQKALP